MSDEATTIDVEERGDGILIITIQGDLDSMGTRTVESSFSAAVPDRGSTVVIDLSNVGFISSAGMAMLLVKGKALRQGGGSMSLAGASRRVYEVLALAGFHELFMVYPTLDEALEGLGG
ncbi:MAG: STAS domain-containing protein [Chloroflexi bacterium]|nr:STAS domain-containing protein [Chloroflexota bacterium]